MKPTILISLLSLIFATTAFSQSPNNVRSVKATKKMDKVVKLNESQFRRVNEAYLNMYRQLEDAQSQKDSKSAKKDYEIKADFNNSLTAILSANQLTKWYEQNGDDSSPVKYMNPKKRMMPEEKAQTTAKRKTDRMTKDYNLTKDQQNEVYEAFLEQSSKTNALRQMVKDNPKSARDKRILLNEELEKKIIDILNEDQVAKMKELQQKRSQRKATIEKKQMQSRSYSKSDKIARKAESQTNYMAPRLKLTEEQKIAYHAASLEKFRALDAINATASQKSTGEKNIMRQQVQDDFDKKVAEFLSAEQLERLKVRTK